MKVVRGVMGVSLEVAGWRSLEAKNLQMVLEMMTW